MDLTLVITLVPAAALAGAGVPFISRRRRARLEERAQIEYLEGLLVEARRSTFPVAARRVWI